MGEREKERESVCVCLGVFAFQKLDIYINADVIIFSLMSEFYVMHRKTFPSPIVKYIFLYFFIPVQFILCM